MLRNPVDILAEPLGDGAWVAALKALDGWEESDMLLWQMSPDMEPIRTEEFCRIIIDIRRAMVRAFSSVQKPKALVIHTLETHSGLEEMVVLREACREQKIAFYPSVYRAARAISRYIEYQQHQQQRM
jgi:acyl-CoA synthetase (NDP forming)